MIDTNKTPTAVGKKKTRGPAQGEALRRTEQILCARKSPPSSDSEPNVHRLLHELQVHQVELEMQNEELSRTRDELETLRSRYFDLFELAPVGYLTLSEQGLIIEANLTATNLLGLARDELIDQPFNRFILDNEAQDLFYLLRKQVAVSGKPHPCDLRMVNSHKTEFFAHLTARCIYKKPDQPQLFFLTIEDSSEREDYKIDLEEIVKNRTAELVLAKEGEEKRRVIAEVSFVEIKKLKAQLEGERTYLQNEIKQVYNYEDIIGQSDAINDVFFKIEQIAGTDTNVFILGETGTGKELVARAIHGMSMRKNRTLVKMNCAALPSNLIESELFGHEKGAFTGAHSRRAGRFEIADDGTLFLDEIGELPLELQSKLLQVIQSGEFERVGSSKTIKVDVRIIAATNRNMEEEIGKGKFRDDLWYRLNIFPITVPPLRDRLDDIPLLVDFYVNKISKRLGKTIESVPSSVMDTLQSYHWPGNVRELENVLERGVIVSSGPKLRLADELKKPFTELSASRKTLDAVERDHIVQVLEQTHWKVGGKNSAAETLGLDRSTLRARMRKLDIQKP
jgi:chemotaxis protein methyltransferase CheR